MKITTSADVIIDPISLKSGVLVTINDARFMLVDTEACELITQIQKCLQYMADRSV